MNSINRVVISCFVENKRDLPWRKTNPWGVMVSEFMLQQTPVSRVLPKWDEWMQRWPTPESLASATTAEVITAWGRLGYPRRALRLHESAKIITGEYGGNVPRSQRELIALPGVGEYTAAAIAAFAFEERSLVLDINIRRFLSRVVDGIEFPTPAPTSREKRAREILIPEEGAHLWAAGTMELGALICTAKNPKCEICPVSETCQWRLLGFPKSEQIRKTQAWHGTDRQCRGTIIQSLRENKSLTEAEIMKLWHDDSQLERSILGLLQDGLIAELNPKTYALPG
jgi:A/G-specific adenine glycosylase